MLVYLDTRKWMTLVEWLEETGEAEDLGDDVYLIPEVLEASMQHVTDVVGRFIARHELDFLYGGAQERKLAWTPIQGVEELLGDAHFHDDRGLFEWLDDDAAAQRYPYVASPVRFDRSNVRVRRRAPNLNEHQELWGAASGLAADRADETTGGTLDSARRGAQ
jgi:crotonobetainyl-CoA:carnitine CoA-transferase CaiB-like acyl-CoA transferase